jgi:putative glutamine amidotransferase
MVGATPLMIPGLPETQDIGHLVGIFDGIVLTGGRANVHPEEWGATPSPAHEPYDRGRDRVALPLIRACVDAGLPLLGICRGMQEMNVAFGGTLHPEIRDLPGRMNHRMPRGDDVTREEIFRPRHCVHLVPGGTFARLYGSDEIFVNSLHGQGICEPADRVVIEGRADDTTPEAITIADAPGFALGVQWHAEYEPREQAVNAVIWNAFRKAIEGRDWLPA